MDKVILTPPYLNAVAIVKCNRIFVMKTKDGSAWKKIVFPSEKLVFNLIALLTTYTG
jgi:hypothetical protein